MNTTHKLSFDLARKTEIIPPVHVVQGDTNTRVLEITLRENGAAWTPAEGTSFGLAFRKPDSTSGLYDTLPDGSAAATVADNVVSVVLAPQILTAPGTVTAILVIQDTALNRISTFPFDIEVAPDPSAGAQVSNNYYYFSTLDALNNAIGNLGDLQTNDKSSLVAAINEAAKTGSGGSGGGVTFTPAVDSEGNLSWSNNGALDNPETVNIMGPPGPQGVSGVYVGSGDMPEGYNIQIDPDGESALLALTFTGAVDETYDGSKAVTVEIPNVSAVVKTINGVAPDENGNVEIAISDPSQNAYVLPVGGDELGGVKNGGNVVINADGTMTAPDSGGVTAEQVETAVSAWLDEHPEVTTTVQDDSITEEKLAADVRAKLNSSAGGGYILGNTEQTEGSASFAEMFQKVKNEVMLDYMGDINKIPVIAHTDQHGALNGSDAIVGVFQTIADLVNWNDISKVINLGDCVANAWKDASDIPWLACTELEKVVTTQAPIPLEKQLNVFGNHDQFTWDFDANTYGDQMTNQAPLQQYFRNIKAHRRSNNGWFTVEDGYFNVKYVVTSAYEGTGKFATTEQFDFLISELGKDDGFDIVLIAHELYNPDYIGRVFPTTSDMIAKGSAENDNDYGMGLDVGAILTARRNKTAGIFTDGSGVVHDFDFSNCKTELLCSLHGHTHYETYNYVNDNYLNVALSPMTFGNRWMFFCLIDRGNQVLKVWKMPAASSLTEYTYEKYEIPFSVADAEAFVIKSRVINCAVFNTSTSIRAGQPYSQYVKAKSGYTLGTVKVEMGGTDVTADYYDSDNQLIHIPAVTGDIDLVAYDSTIDTDADVYVVTETYDSAKVTRTTYTSKVVNSGETYKVSFSPKSGYRIEISAYMGGVDISESFVTNSQTIDEVTGDVDIYVTAIPITLTNESVDSDGTVTEDTTCILSGYEDVSGYDYINAQFGKQGGYRYVAQYDAEYNFISRTDSINLGSSTNNDVYLSENTKYIRFGVTGLSDTSEFTSYSLRKYLGETYANVTIDAPDTVSVDGVVETIKYGSNLVLTVTDLTGYEDIEISTTVTVGGTEMKVDIESGILTVPYITGDVVVTIKSVRPLMYELTEELALTGDGTTIDTGVNPMSSVNDSFTILIDYTPNTPSNETVIFSNTTSSLPNNGIRLRKYTGTNTEVLYAGAKATVSSVNANTDRCKMALTHSGGSDSYDANYTFNTASLSTPVSGTLTNVGGSAAARRVSAANIVIGGLTGTWTGTIHSFRIWNKVLTDEEIAAFVAFEETTE